MPERFQTPIRDIDPHRPRLELLYMVIIIVAVVLYHSMASKSYLLGYSKDYKNITWNTEKTGFKGLG